MSSARYVRSVESLEGQLYESDTLWKETLVKSRSEHARLEERVSQLHAKLTSEIQQIASAQSQYQNSLDELILRIGTHRVAPEFSPSRGNSRDDEYITMDGHRSLSDELEDANIKAQGDPTPLQVRVPFALINLIILLTIFERHICQVRAMTRRPHTVVLTRFLLTRIKYSRRLLLGRTIDQNSLW